MKPILFNGESARAILDGRKTQTRRIAKLPEQWHRGYGSFDETHPNGREEFVIYGDCGTKTMDCPYGKVGDKLWVREKWRPLYEYCNPNGGIVGACFRYMGGGRIFNDKHKNHMHIDDTYNFKPSIHMPKWACRIFLEITDIRVERVQDISEADVEAEGILCPGWYSGEFRILWDSINEKRGYGWDVNPYVWVVEFKRVKN